MFSLKRKRKDFIFGILELHLGGLKKYIFNAKMLSSIREYIAGAIIFLHVFVYIEKITESKMSDNKL